MPTGTWTGENMRIRPREIAGLGQKLSSSTDPEVKGLRVKV
jgi:hypothetical protein